MVNTVCRHVTRQPRNGLESEAYLGFRAGSRLYMAPKIETSQHPVREVGRVCLRSKVGGRSTTVFRCIWCVCHSHRYDLAPMILSVLCWQIGRA